MDDNAPKETPPANPAENAPVDFNKIDLSQLQGFSFGTQWSVDKSSPSEARDRPRRDDRRDGPGGGGPDRRDRRTFRKPAGAPGGDAPAGAPERRDFSGGGPARRDGPGGGPGGEYRGGPRRDGPGGGGDYRGGPRRSYGGGYGGRGEQQDFRPYESPYFSVTFYPEDTSFNTLVQTIRKSCRTIELFEIARTVVAKTDRFVVVVSRRPQAERPAPAPVAPAAGDAAAPAKAEPAPRPAMQPIYVSLPDGLPFESEEAAVSHVVSNHLDKFFDMAEVEVDPPKGNFQVVNKCGVTGELLGPPNYHRYNQIVQQHHAAKVARMPLEAFRSRIETIRDPEAVNQWLAKMKKTTRYTWKTPAPKAAKPAATETDAPTPAPVTEPVSEAPAAETPAADAPVVAPTAPVETPAAPAAPAAPTFDAFEDARMHLLTNAREKIVRAVEHARFHGKVAETMPQGEIRRAIEGALERQRKFPLDTANALRGRLRREHFTIFKKGSKGVSYVCAVKRKFRVPGQTFADSIGGLITFIETHPMIRASELPSKLLGITLPAAPAAPVEGAAPVAPAPELTVDERAKIVRLQGDLMWLVREGYVTEFIDGTLYAPPPVVEARKKEVEAEEHDPENFPEARPPGEASESAPAPAESVESAPEPAAPAVEVPAEAPAVVESVPVAEETKSEPPVA